MRCYLAPRSNFLFGLIHGVHAPGFLVKQQRPIPVWSQWRRLLLLFKDKMPLEFELCPGRMIGGNHPCFIIAEIGQNHQGDIEIAKKMIKMAKDCGSDCAKFQKSELDHKFNKKALERPYNSVHSWGKTYGDHKRHLEFSHEQYKELQKYADEVDIFFTASGMDEMAVEFLHELNVPFFKVASADNSNFPYLKKTAKKGRPMVVSSGMQNMETMRQVYKTVKEHNPNFTILQCTSAYPLEAEDVNLRVLTEYQKEFPDIPIGYSGHESGIVISVAAVAMGAKVVERHVTLDKTWKGNDHEASLVPSELAELVRSIRLVERALGNGVKQMLPCEKPCHDKLGKSLVAKVKIPKGTVLTQDMLAVKVAEPMGIDAEDIFKMVGKKVKKDVEEDESILPEVVEGYCKKRKC
uniref:N-acetylneuraminate-9-phosphate synthase n=2 Tax=Gasterosteus aculeatus aculeatus TaxID=481459 RepID=A0AAQ4R5R9_GASAC